MNDDQYDDDLDLEDDDDVFDKNGILKDGKSFRCPVQFMDSVQMAIYGDSMANHKPGWRTPDHVSDQDRIVADSYAGYVDHLRGGAKPPKRPVSLADSQAAAEAAYQERSAWLRDAWKGGRP